ncbi:MAG: hypothetical protein NC930_06155 [Candidatus Omnitrophica bacterium]|nr:hypothetical protein [Candidatus Omnitrophota bacterium]
MDIQDKWGKALRHTEIIRSRILPLATFAETHLPYVFLAESSVNTGDTVVRRGEVIVDRPAIILPSNLPQFFGFDSEEEKFDYDALTNFFLVRGVRFPSLKYNNKTHSLDIREGKLKDAIEFYLHELQKQENTTTGLIVGPEDSWQFSILIFICYQASRSADNDIRKLLDDSKEDH